MKNILSIPFFALMLLGGSVAGQNNGVTVGFLINGVALKAMPYQPTDPDDKDHVLRVDPDSVLMFRDASTGASTTDFRFWDFNGDLLWDTISQAAIQVSFVYRTAGFFAVTYCVGHTKQCATRWVYVEGAKPPKRKEDKPEKETKSVEFQVLSELPEEPPMAKVVEVDKAVEAPKAVVTAAPPPAPRSWEAVEEQPDMFIKTGRAGIPLSKYATAQNCVGKSQSNFTANLQPKTAMDLVSFVVYASDCGGLNLTITGPEFTETVKIVVNKGKNQIDLEDYDIRLHAGTQYTMAGKGIAGMGGCGSSKPPMFEDVSKCTNVASENHPNLVLDQKKSPCVFELRFLYQ